MKRSVELFIQKGIVNSLATSQIDGVISIPDPLNPTEDDEAILVKTSFLHSFVNPNTQPAVGTDVFFFIIPFEYLKNQVDLLAVNVTSIQRKMEEIGQIRFFPCNTITTVKFDQNTVTNTREYYGINDYGELNLITVGPSQNLLPWDKIICENIPSGNSNRVTSLKRSPNRPTTDPIEFKLLKMNFDRIDPNHRWVDV